MSENILTFPRRLPRQQVAPNAVIGVLIFIATEIMMFAGFVSAFTITRAAYNTWPPIGQPRLPAGATLINTSALIASGIMMHFAARAWQRDPALARRPTLIALVLGLFFVCFQGAEWVRLIHEGLTLTSSNHGAFFYLIIGMHGLHASAAILALGIVYLKMAGRGVSEPAFRATRFFWYFVVAVWPVLYLRVYL